MTRTLAVRLDSLGDVLVTGPAIRALANVSEHLGLLCGPRGREAGELLPGVDELHTFHAGWIDPRPRPVHPAEIEQLVEAVAAGRWDRAVVFTSFHQSPLPTALLLRMAGVPWIGAISEDYPGSLLDLRHRCLDDQPETERALGLARSSGGRLPLGDAGRLAVRADVLAPGAGPVPDAGYVVLHPGTSAPARAWPAARFREACHLLTGLGRRVVVTGSPQERALTGRVAGDEGEDWGGTSFAGLARVLAGADVVVVGNTGPAHLAAAVGTPVVSLFAPTVPAVRWAPHGVATTLLGDAAAPCRGSRATVCPVPGHPCLTSVSAADVVAAVDALAPAPPVHATSRRT